MKNTLIKASAGTGKTFALATRMIRLMLLGTEPQHIVALTFSRAAAGEIFSRVAGRLAAAAADAAGAAEEAGHIFKGFDPARAAKLREAYPQGFSSDVFAGLLRKLITSQHISMIGTIDSFMTRMVQAFPLELGLQGGLAMMDDYQAAREKRAAAAALLNTAAGSEAATRFCEAFHLATMGREDKSFCEKLDAFIDTWHAAFLDRPEAAAWGNPTTIWPATRSPFPIHSTPQHLAARLRDTLRATWEAVGRAAAWDEFCAFVEAFNGTFSEKAAVKNVLEAYTPGGDITIAYNKKKVTFTAEQAQLIREAVETLFGLALTTKCNHTQGIHRLMSQIEAVYSAVTRRQGKLVFDDVPRLIAGLDQATRQNIEYRFDTRFRHWALDEFQDTSHAQWNAIRNLVEEAVQSTDERSMFIVGDMKQAIYGWRGGDVAIFEREAASGLYEPLALDSSYRYAPEIADCVNRIFGGPRVEAFLAARAADAGAKWARLWNTHHSAVQRAGFVSVERVPAADKEKDERDMDPYLNAACGQLNRIRPWERGISAAVLVCANAHGAAFAEALRATGIPAVWEGESAISDTPVVAALLNLLRVAEHPGNTLAWQHVRATPLATQVFADVFARPEAAAVRALSKRVLDDVSRHGLPRALRLYIEAIGETDPFTRGRLDLLLRVAVQFTAAADAEATLTDFADYVNGFTTRDVADTSTVKIVTVHRSKGLGFDYVILPIIERLGIGSPRPDDILSAPDGAWLLTRPPKPVVDADPVLAAAATANLNAKVFESLCVQYVAMTRAKRAMTVLLKPSSTTSSDTLFFSNHIEASLGGELPWQQGDEQWFTAFAAPPLSNEPTEASKCRRAPSEAAGNVSMPRRKIASAHERTASELFAARDTEATRRGKHLHALLQKIEWLDGDDTTMEMPLLPAFRDALRKPSGLVELWRERSFEALDSGEWVSGVFDRVAIIEENGRRRAELYDYKTNRPRDNENAGPFAERMRQTYSPQMATYRRALTQLTGIPATDIRVTLLLTETMAAVEV